ncbi:MAG: deoxyribodipyrimidine photo-lyase, partial [Oricola sp.]
MKLPKAPVVAWFRNDLRTADNLALLAAGQSGNSVIPLFILESGSDALPLGGAQAWWLHHSLASLSRDLARLGAPLVLRRGDPLGVLREVIAATGAKTVLWNRRYAPSLTDRDAAIKAALREDGVGAESFDGRLLHEPTRLRTGSGGPYKVFTPFWRALSRTHHPRPPAPAPARLARFDGDLPADRLDDWQLGPKAPDWSGG